MMAELIDREALLEVIAERNRNTCNGSMSCLQMRRMVKDIPTIDPESLRPTGEWIITGEEYRAQDVSCSVCGDTRGTYGWPRAQLIKDCEKRRFCSYCGARMKGAGE